MSWCGGGEINATPGCVCRRRAISAVTLCPGSCPPSPGFEPCAILIWSSSAKLAYSGVTPNRPLATCLIRQFLSFRYRAGSSPPSPVLAFPPKRLNAIASVSCASAPIAPCEIAPVENRFTISDAAVTDADHRLDHRFIFPISPRSRRLQPHQPRIDRFVQRTNGERVRRVVLAAFVELHVAGIRELRRLGTVRRRVTSEDVGGD